MTRSDSYSQTIKQRTHIQVVDITHIETDNRILFRWIHRSIDLYSINSLELIHTVAGELVLMLLDGFKTDGIDIFNRFCESVGSHIVRGSSLKFER